MNLPYLIPDFPGIGGTLKQRPEDFFVQEQPLYEPSGEGEHVYCEVQKIGMTTFDAIDRIARLLDLPPRDIGYAGLKDAQAITQQVFSIPRVTEEQVMRLQVPNLKVLWAARHGNKLRLGHLAGNRFAIKIRDVTPTDVVKLKPVVAQLQRRGMPNYFGEQRFGRRGDNDVLGALLIAHDNKGLIGQLLGRPDPAVDDGPTLEARRRVDRGDLEGALGVWPRHGGMERRVLARLIKTHRPSAAIRLIDERVQRLWVSALQSRLFNDVLARRIGSLDRLLDGDVAYKHENGACFTVDAPADEQSRADAFEISPTGPLIGYRMTFPQRAALEIEQAVLSEAGLKPEDFRQSGRHRIKGARRPLRVQPKEISLAAGVDEHGSHITVAFTLPAGSFATMFLREIMRTDAAAEGPGDADSQAQQPSPLVEDEEAGGGD